MTEEWGYQERDSVAHDVANEIATLRADLTVVAWLVVVGLFLLLWQGCSAHTTKNSIKKIERTVEGMKEELEDRVVAVR